MFVLFLIWNWLRYANKLYIKLCALKFGKKINELVKKKYLNHINEYLLCQINAISEAFVGLTIGIINDPFLTTQINDVDKNNDDNKDELNNDEINKQVIPKKRIKIKK